MFQYHQCLCRRQDSGDSCFPRASGGQRPITRWDVPHTRRCGDSQHLPRCRVGWRHASTRGRQRLPSCISRPVVAESCSVFDRSNGTRIFRVTLFTAPRVLESHGTICLTQLSMATGTAGSIILRTGTFHVHLTSNVACQMRGAYMIIVG